MEILLTVLFMLVFVPLTISICKMFYDFVQLVYTVYMVNKEDMKSIKKELENL